MNIHHPTPSLCPFYPVPHRRILAVGPEILSRYGLGEDLRPEEAALGPLDDLLVHGDGRVVHDDRALAVVDLGIDAGIADQVDDPLLTLGVGKTETGGKIPGLHVSD